MAPLGQTEVFRIASLPLTFANPMSLTFN